MKFCTRCGKELADEAIVCVGCGCSQKNNIYYKDGDSKSFGWALLGFFVPLVGLILYLVWNDSYPMRAKSSGKGTLAGAVTGVVLTVLFYVLYFAIIIWAVMYQ